MNKLEANAKLVVASHNPGKVWEIKQLIAPFGLDAVSAGDLDLPEPIETEATFEGNAKLKAVAAAKVSGLPALGDDSGLEVEILDGAPGIYSARWAGPSKDFGAAMKKLADEIEKRGGWQDKAEGEATPRANFICVLCLAWPDGESEVFTGRVFGHLVRTARGGNGFGYDPMFVADGNGVTFGEMAPDEKDAISHRSRAFQAFKTACLDHLSESRIGNAGVSEDNLEALSAAAANLSDKDQVVRFIANLRQDLAHHNADWQNVTLEDFLEAMQAWIDDTDVKDEPRWRTLANVLLAASRYE